MCLLHFFLVVLIKITIILGTIPIDTLRIDLFKYMTSTKPSKILSLFFLCFHLLRCCFLWLASTNLNILVVLLGLFFFWWFCYILFLFSLLIVVIIWKVWCLGLIVFKKKKGFSDVTYQDNGLVISQVENRPRSLKHQYSFLNFIF